MLKEQYQEMGISTEVFDYCEKICKSLEDRFKRVDEIAEINQLKVLKAMQKNKVSDIHFAASSGYGYNDLGRDTLEGVYADVFHTETALVRPAILCGTHALTVALFGNLRPGDEVLSPVGKPYDTLDGVIGITPTAGSLAEYGVTYAQVDLLPDFSFDYEGIKASINDKTKLVTIQRSKGYAVRPTFSVDVGADMVVGSLIKNPGGGLAPIGGYIAGKEKYVDMASYRMSCPGLGKEIGASLGLNQQLYQGLFMAPTVTAGAVKGAIFAANVYESLGFDVLPDSKEDRYDIIQAVSLKSGERLRAFCEGIQAAAPVDSFVTPEPWDMPGYNDQVIMAAGAFVQGSSIELSADGPMREPYAAYFQGGLTFNHAKFGIMMSLQKIFEKGLLESGVLRK